MSDLCAMLKAYQLPIGKKLDEFYTAETYYAIQMAEFEAEREYEMAMEKIAQYDPYEDYADYESMPVPDYDYEVPEDFGWFGETGLWD